MKLNIEIDLNELPPALNGKAAKSLSEIINFWSLKVIGKPCTLHQLDIAKNDTLCHIALVVDELILSPSPYHLMIHSLLEDTPQKFGWVTWGNKTSTPSDCSGETEPTVKAKTSFKTIPVGSGVFTLIEGELQSALFVDGCDFKVGQILIITELEETTKIMKSFVHGSWEAPSISYGERSLIVEVDSVTKSSDEQSLIEFSLIELE